MIRRRMLMRAALLALAAGCVSAGRAVAQAPPQAPVPGAQQDSVVGVRQDSALADLCQVTGYCENVTRQVQRYFRAPADSAGARGEVCFRILHDGGVTDITTQGGGVAFRLAMMEAVQAAGERRAFGNLPGEFDPARWRWCVELRPA